MRLSDKKELNGLGWLFFLLLLIRVTVSLAIGVLAQKGIVFSTEASLIISEMVVLIPALVYVLIKNCNFRTDLGFRPVKAGTVFMCIFLAFLILPAGSFVNLLSQLFVSNTMADMADPLMEGSKPVILFLGSVFGPFCEEFLFRSVFNNRYERFVGPMRAGLISALFFALAHLNINQASYGFVMGFFFSVVNKAAGSVYPSIIVHACINGTNLLFVMITDAIYRSSGMDVDLAGSAEAVRGSDLFYYMTGGMLFLAVICSVAAIPCIVWISKHEGNRELLYDMFVNRHEKDRWLNIPVLLALCLALFIMFGLDVFLSVLKGPV